MPRPGEPPYHLRPFDQGEAERHLEMMRAAEQLYSRREVERGLVEG